MSQFHRTKTPGVSFKETRSGRSYYIDYVDDTKRRRREKVEGGFDAARDALAVITSKRSGGEAVAGRVDVTYRDYSNQVIDRRLALGKIKPQSANEYRGNNNRHVVPVLGDLKLNKITKHDVLRVITTMQAKGLSGWTVNGAITVMSMVLSDAQWAFGIPNHVKSLKREHRPDTGGTARYHVLEPDEIGRLLNQARKRNARIVTLFLLAIYAGLRQSELCGLWWEDLTLAGDNPTVRVHAQLGRDGKTRLPYLKGKREGEFRVVEFPRFVAKALLELRMQSSHSGPTDYVFGEGLAYSQTAARSMFERCRDGAKIQADVPVEDRCTFHDMRDTYASMLISGGANVVEIAAAMGHTKKNGEPDPATTLNYYSHEWKKLEKRGKLRDILEASAL